MQNMHGEVNETREKNGKFIEWTQKAFIIK